MLFEKQILGAFRKNFLRRCDDTGTAFYFSAADFPGLISEPFSFPSSKGHTLVGSFYHYEDPIPGRIVVFDHGFGGGHRSYMKEIEMLARHGFLVFAYDHTGCMLSGGENILGFSQSLCDLNDCLTALKASERCRDLSFSVMGHSWGGFSTLNIAALHPDITHVVVLSGFVSVELLVQSIFSGMLSPYRKSVLNMEIAANPDFVGFDAVKSLSATDARVLLVYSENDALVKKNVHYDALEKGLSHRENVRFLLLPNKGHNPNYTEDAVAYLAQYSSAVGRKLKKKELETDVQKQLFLASFDWDRMTEQDVVVWAKIFQTLDT